VGHKAKAEMTGLEHLFLDAAAYYNHLIFSHLNTAEAIEMANELKAKHLYLIQVGHSYPVHHRAVKRIKHYWDNYKKENKIQSSMNITLTYDGLSINTHK